MVKWQRERNVTPGTTYRQIRASEHGRHFLTFLPQLRCSEKEPCHVSSICCPTHTSREDRSVHDASTAALLRCVWVCHSFSVWPRTISGCGQRTWIGKWVLVFHTLCDVGVHTVTLWGPPSFWAAKSRFSSCRSLSTDIWQRPDLRLSQGLTVEANFRKLM